MKKLLIYYPEDVLEPKGGPAGYLYNLKKGLEECRKQENLPVDISFYSNMPSGIENNSELRKRIPKRLLEFRRALNDARFLRKKFPIDNGMFAYDIIHFHSAEKMYLCRDFLNQYHGKVILTSHCPCGIYKERIDKLNPFDYKLMRNQIDKLEELDRYAFERADYIIFPCKDAEEPYFNTWPRYTSIRKDEKYRYMPTGIIACHAKINRENYRKKYGIPNDAFVISYVGRHNEIKGYADLRQMGEQVLKDPNTYFLIGGKEEPIKGLNNDRWIEVGWTTDPYSLIAASDVFVLPNRETYFDLVLLEALSLGIPVVLSDTGGNKFFKKYDLKGLKYFSSVDQGVEAIKCFQLMDKQIRKKAGEKLAELCETEFSVKEFAHRYIQIISEIVETEV